MSNMSYCRFQNTRGDYADCVETIEEMTGEEGNALGADELRAAQELAMKSIKMVELLADYTGIDVAGLTALGEAISRGNLFADINAELES